MIRFSHRVWYRDKATIEAMICGDCGAQPLYEWKEVDTSFVHFYGVIEMLAVNVRCPNGPHEIDDATLAEIKAADRRGQALEEHVRKGWKTRKLVRDER